MTETDTTLPAPLGSLDRGLAAGLAAGLALLCLAVYLPILSAEFVYDDHSLIEANRGIASIGAAWQAFFQPLWDMPGGQISNAFWRPLTLLVLACGRALFSFDPAGYHALSLGLHLAATWAAWRLATRLTRCATLGWLAAALFAVHPVHVESVAWISALNDPLYGLFALLSLERYFAWRERGLRGVPWSAGVLFLLALLSKEQALVVPAVALVIDLVFRHLRFKGEGAGEELLRAYAPWGAALAAYYLGRVIAYGGDLLAGFDQASADFGLGFVRGMQLRVEILGGYLEGLFFPIDPRFFRQVRPVLPEDYAPYQRAVLASVLWALATGAALWRGKRLAAAMLLAIPTSFVLLLVNTEAAGAFPISDRFLYVPTLFGTVLVVGLLAKFLPRPAVFAVGLGVVAVSGWVANGRTRVFHDDMSLYRRALAAEPDNMRGRVYLGRELLELYHDTLDKEYLDEATFHFLTALMLGYDYGRYTPKFEPDEPWIQKAKKLDIALNGVPVTKLIDDDTVFRSFPDRVDANLGLGECVMALGNLPPDYDLEWPQLIYESITERFPNLPPAWDGLGKTFFWQRNYEAAEQALRTAVDLDPGYAEGWHDLGIVLQAVGRYDEARTCFKQALAIRPGVLNDLTLAAGCAVEAERWDIATGLLNEAERLHPDSVEPLYLRGVMLAKRGDLSGAVQRFDVVIARLEAHPNAWLNKGMALQGLGDRAGAIQAYRRAAELQPDGFAPHWALVQMLLSNPEGRADALPYLERAYQLSPPDQRRATVQQLLLHELMAAGKPDLDQLLGFARFDQQRRDFVHALSWTEAAENLIQQMGLESDPRLRSNLIFLRHLRGTLYEGLAGSVEQPLRAEYLNTARDSFLACLGLSPKHFFANNDLAMLYARRLNRPDLAVKYARTALKNIGQVEGQAPPGAIGALKSVLGAMADYVPPVGPVLDDSDG
jgi:protein O-mannosyl-transferase